MNKGALDGGVDALLPQDTHNDVLCICWWMAPQPAGFSINWRMSVEVQLILIVVNANVVEDRADNISPLDKRRIVVMISSNNCSSPTLQGLAEQV